MKKTFSVLTTAALALSLAACGAEPSPAETENTKWSRTGYYIDEDQNMAAINPAEDSEGWMVGCFLDEDAYSAVITQEGSVLKGELTSDLDSSRKITVTVSEDGDEGIALTVDGDKTYHFGVWEMPDESEIITVTIDTAGTGTGHFTAVTEADSEEATDGNTVQMIINMEDPAEYTLTALPEDDSEFVMWTKDGNEISTEEVLVITFDKDTEITAVFDLKD